MSTETYVEDNPIILPVLDDTDRLTVTRLGDLWNCHESKYVGNNMFKEYLDGEYITASPVQDDVYKLIHCKSTFDKIKTLKVGGEISLELLSGAISVKGSADYNNDETEIKNTEQIICYSRKANFSVEVLPFARNIIDSSVSDQILNNTIKATHFVGRITLGAEVNADILITQNDKSSKSDIKGDFFGKIIYGPVDASLKANLSFLDSEDDKSFRKEINVHSIPSIGKNPKSVKEMFDLIENISTVVEKHKYFPKYRNDVIGVPIRFVLMPIKQFLDFKIEKLYLKLSDKVLDDFKTMLIRVQDIQVPGYVFKKVLEMNSTLALLLFDKESKLTRKIRSYEEELRKIGIKYFEESAKTLKQYKVQNATVEDLLGIINRFKSECNPGNVFEKMVKFKEKGEDELLSIGYANIEGSKSNFDILTNRNSLKLFIAGDDKDTKMWLHTNDKAPEGVFSRLYEMIKSLSENKIKVGIAIKSISYKFQLCVKVREKDHKSYNLEEIPYALNIIGAAVGVGFDNELLFHSMNAEMMNIKLPLKFQKKVININDLIEKCLIFKNIIITQSHFETWTLLTRNDNKWKFFMPIDAKETSYLAFRHLYSLTLMFKDIDLIVGNLNETESMATGFLFLIKNSKVEAVCLDDFDLILLEDKFLERTESEILILSPKNMKNSFYPKRAESSEAVIKSIEFNSHETLNINEYDLESFKEIPNVELMNCLELTCALSCGEELNFIATMAKFALKESNELKTILSKAGYSLTNNKFYEKNLYEKAKQSLIDSVADFISIQNPFSLKIQIAIQVMNIVIKSQEEDLQKYEEKVSQVLEDIMNNQNCTEELKNLIAAYTNSDLKYRCTQIKTVLEKQDKKLDEDKIFHTRNFYSVLINASKYNLIDILMLYINKISLNENIFGKVKERFMEDLKNEHFHRLIVLLSKCLVGEKYFILHKGLEKYCESMRISNRITAILSLLHQLTYNELFDETHWQELWENNRFQYIIRSESDDPRVLNKLLQMGCQNIVPHYIPKDIALKIDKLRQQDTDFELPDEIKYFDQFLNILRCMQLRKHVPEKFRRLLIASMNKNILLYKKLEELRILDIFKWDFEYHLFPYAIEIEIITKVVDEIDRHENLSNSETQQEPIDLGQLNMRFEQIEQLDIQRNQLITVHEKFASVYGNLISPIDYGKFVCLNTILEKPLLESNNLQQGVVKILPYIIQKIKMWGCNAITSNDISSLIDKSNECDNSLSTAKPSCRTRKLISSAIPKKEEKFKFPLSRLDTITGVINSMDPIVSQDILNIMAKFPVALPLIIRDLNAKDSFKNLIPWLTQPIIKWESSPGIIIENHLFVDKFKMIVTLRIGKSSDGISGKSSIINQLFSKRNMFSCCGEPGAKRGKPITLEGSVEFVWLTQETASPELWKSVLQEHYESGVNEIILLANVHGRALDFENHLKIFKTIASSYIFFIMPEENGNLDDDWDQLEEILEIEEGDNKIYDVAIDPPFGNNYPEELIIETSKIANDSNIEKLRNIFKKCLIKPGKTIDVKNLESFEETKIAEMIETDESRALVKFVEQNSCKYVKNIMSLQRGNKTNMECGKEWTENKKLQEVIKLMGNVLSLKSVSRLKAMIHIEKELNRISDKESEPARKKYHECRDQLEKTIGDDLVMISQLRKLLKNSLDEIDNISLGLEHFYREIGKIYEIYLVNNPKNNPYADLAKRYAELFAGGQAIELLNGDSEQISELWLSAIFDNVYRKYPGMRIFVISILGLQSSGKSTLLNALFACKFAVSVGRCTKGLFMRLLFLDEKMKETLDYDAILLIDTEGLGAPEKQIEPDAEKKDRIMACFAMGISHLTIVNVLGEYTDTLTEILQIAIVAMARLEKVDISPDILMVQHLTERSGSKMTNANQVFVAALDKAIQYADEEDVDLRIRESKCLDRLRNTISTGNLFLQFRPFKNGASVYSSPSDEYHQDVVVLYKSIVDIARNSKNKADFRGWRHLIKIYWDSIKEENLMRFKDMKALKDHLERINIIAKVKDSIESAFRVHSEELKSFITEQANKLNKQEVTRTQVLKTLKDRLKLIPSNCPSVQFCEQCIESNEKQSKLYESVAKKPTEADTRQTIYKFIDKTRDYHFNKLSQMMSAIAYRKFESAGIMDKIEKKLIELLRTGKKFSDDEIDSVRNDIWCDIKGDAMDRVTQTPVYDQILQEISVVYVDSPQFVKNLKGKSIQDLRKINAILRRTYERNFVKEKYKSGKALFQGKSDFLELTQTNELKGNIKELSRTLLNECKAENYQKGMICKLKNKVEKITEDFEKDYDLKLKPEFICILHLFANQLFIKNMSEKQRKWDEDHNPLTILLKNESQYMDIISKRLQYGFSYESEGLIVGQSVLLAIEQKVVQTVNEQMINDVFTIDWLSNPESVRLKYFSELVKQVEDNNFNDALKHFYDPKTQIENWFINKVNDLSKGKEVVKFEKIFTSQLSRAKQEIINKQSINDILKLLKDSFFCDEIKFTTSLDVENANRAEIEIFRTRILEVLNIDERYYNYHIIRNIKFESPSSDKEVKDRMGCNFACPFCSALCWGRSGHNEDEGESKRHHTCHQPMGLSGVHKKETNELRCNSCNDQQEGHTWYLGEKRMKWSELKSLPKYNTWKYETHYFIKFNEMMKWFFFKLNENIARNRDLELPNIQDIRKYRLNCIDISSVMATINSKI